ncbi:mRNA stability protein [Cyphellophora attinorum]|uniref:mRNA stability protein n=1 Tax=Cyphellophora attinorum TaxID=1664694 RepID=A0A0N1HS94_9EURO|nr:mRNA stability protein [Phialophora attinorum]KPI38960.1 mRNA stability protein [Phialophora attinorum]
MNPHQKNKIDINSLSSDEQRLFRLYGKLPNKKDLLQNKLKERKYFDSGDYALSKAGKASDSGMTSIGTEHPTADAIPHLSPLTNQLTRGDSISAGSPPSVSSPISGQEAPTAAAGLHRGSINGIPGGGLPGHAQSRSPVKESSYLARSASVDDGSGNTTAQEGSGANTITTGEQKAGIPIRR